MPPLKFKILNNPLLIVSDNPSGWGGLARHCRDIAAFAATMPEFRVGVLGRGEGNRRRFPFTLYGFHESGEWGQGYIRAAWEDFGAGEDGVILTLDDASRRLWFAAPGAEPPELREFLGLGRSFIKAGYFPIDSTGPFPPALPAEGRAAVGGYDRVCAASEWGRDVLVASGRADAEWLPHGIWMDKFHPIADAKRLLDVERQVILGCNMANQSRKDWPVAFHCASLMRQALGNRFHAWFHTDVLVRAWNFYALSADFGIGDYLTITTQASDEQLALRYSASDVTILPSAGEGFSFPTAESLACGTACIVTNYAAAQELVSEDCRVDPVAYRIDTPSNVRRAVLSGHGFARAALAEAENKLQDPSGRAEELAASVEHLDWRKLEWMWKKWLGGLVK